ncbi:DUF917 domain-containing protein [Pseudoroseicyclus aestuarii]|uniref:DUF917 domain-containing protein n=1 Tax=Pseudoroseicyclus aestuarii TaxID=1795041 RepID=A0A318T5K1_9RHOB|nr:DUF917 domain-containing protein [Pseudoroseicyclus aestuarii]PYE82571.1 hypothetical protein DFP88_104328 [Pseudoroseicyclus aestuarii]
MSTQITAEDLDAVALGGAFLGTGGGGDPYIGKLMAKAALLEHGPVTLIDAAELPEDALCVPVFMMGAPTVMVEKLPAGTEVLAALAQIKQIMGRKATALVCAEAGGLNSTIPFAVAAVTGLPLLNGDGMGRAFPELQMCSFTMHGVKATPLVLADDKGNAASFTTIDNLWTERLARAATVEMGGAALVAAYPMTGAQAQASLLHGTMTLILEIGRTIQEERRAMRHPGEALRALTGGHKLMRARVADIRRETTGGFVRGTATLRGIDEDAGRSFTVDFQNEFLVARDDTGRVLTTTPDLICALDGDAGLPVTTESLRYGLTLELTGIPADPQWRTEAGLTLAGPGYFGYDHAFAPVEALLSTS